MAPAPKSAPEPVVEVVHNVCLTNPDTHTDGTNSFTSTADVGGKNTRNRAGSGQREKTNLCGSCLIMIQFCLVVFPKSIAQGFPGLLQAKMFLNWAIL